MPDVLDSYSEANRDTYGIVRSGATTKIGNSWTNATQYTLDSAKFYLMKTGTPTGSGYAELYSHSGTYGTSSVGDSLLATSDAFDVSTLGGSYTLETLSFSGAQRVTLSASTYYVIVFAFSGGSGSNYVRVGNDQSSPSHDGNMAHYDGSWTATVSRDVCFYVYGESAAPGGRNLLLLGAG
jgi:hypothetical protein